MGTVGGSEDSETNKHNVSADGFKDGKSRNIDHAPIKSSKSLKKKSTMKSSFYPQAKGLNAIEDADSSIQDSKIQDDSHEVQAEEVGKEQEEVELPLRNREKLSHNHINRFYPYEEGITDESGERVIKQKSLERVKTATENRRYKNKSHDMQGKREDYEFTGPIIQKNALMNMKNVGSPKLNQLMKSGDYGEEPPYGIGYGKNPRLQAIKGQGKRHKKKKSGEIELNVTTFYDSNSSRIENQKAREDQEAEEIN